MISFGIKNGDGQIVTEKEDILEVWAKYNENLYYDSEENAKFNINDQEKAKIHKFTLDEIRNGIKKMKTEKPANRLY